jgi:hypothetical protein
MEKRETAIASFTKLTADEITDEKRLEHETALKDIAACETALLEAGATPVAADFVARINKVRCMSVTVVLTGQNNAGEQRIVVGRARTAGTDAHAQWSLPWGIKKYTDADPVAAASRCVREQTGLSQAALDQLAPGKISARYALNHEGVGGGSLYQHFV